MKAKLPEDGWLTTANGKPARVFLEKSTDGTNVRVIKYGSTADRNVTWLLSYDVAPDGTTPILTLVSDTQNISEAFEAIENISPRYQSAKEPKKRVAATRMLLGLDTNAIAP